DDCACTGKQTECDLTICSGEGGIVCPTQLDHLTTPTPNPSPQPPHAASGAGTPAGRGERTAIAPSFPTYAWSPFQGRDLAAQGAHDILVRQRIARGSLKNDLAAVDHIDTIGDRRRAGEIGFRKQERNPESFDHHHRVAETLDH